MRLDAAFRRFDLALIRSARRARKGVRELGPGIITGVADDDPSGISTYTIAGAEHGYRLLWTSPVTLPMNFAVQAICARIGIVTGRGLAEVISEHYGRRALAGIVLLLVVANCVNIGADLGAIAASVELVAGIPAAALIVPVGLAVALVEVVLPYPVLARYLKLLTLVVFAYVLAAFVAGPDWGEALRGTTQPRLSLDRDTVETVVALLGTTISPYLFFWQTSEEVEEEEAHHIVAAGLGDEERRHLVRAANYDVATGMGLASLGFYFVVLAAAAALFAGGAGGGTEVGTAAEAAAALRPLAGDAASLLFALGIIGTGLLAIPVLAGSAAYATSELFGWREGLSSTFRQAPQFYVVILAATLLGMVLNFAPVPEMRALYLAAVLNGVVAPVLLGFIMVTAHDRTILGDAVPGRVLLAIGWVTTASMAAAALVLVVLVVGGEL